VEYTQDLNENNIIFPDRTYTAGATNLDRYDIDWALESPEVVAWTQASDWMSVIYGFGFLTWMANMGIDNNGGNMHEFFWRVTQAFQAVPLIQAYLAWKVITSYSFDYYNEFLNITSENAAKQNRDQMYRRYAVEGSNGISVGGVFDADQVTAQWGIFMSVVMFSLIQSSTYKHVAQSFHEKRSAADMLEIETDAKTI
jgi:hypothetical protein